MEETPTFRPFLFSSIFLAVAGWAGLVLLINYSFPTVWPRWAFYALFVLALVGTALPFTYFFNVRFANPEKPFPYGAVARQAIWVGVFGAVQVWLLIGRVLNLTLAIWIALGFILIEYLIRMRENNPPVPKIKEQP